MSDLNGEFLAELLSRDIKVSPGISAFFNFFDSRGNKVTIVSSLEDRVRLEVNNTFEYGQVAIMSTVTALFDNSSNHVGYLEIESKKDTVYIDHLDPQYIAVLKAPIFTAIKSNLIGDKQTEFVNESLERYITDKESQLEYEVIQFNRNCHYITDIMTGFLTSYGIQDNPKKDMLVKIVFEAHGLTYNHSNFTSKMHDVARDLKRLAPLIK